LGSQSEHRICLTLPASGFSHNNENYNNKGVLLFVQSSVPVNMQIDIAPQHHLFIIGRNGVNIKQIMQQTGARSVVAKFVWQQGI